MKNKKTLFDHLLNLILSVLIIALIFSIYYKKDELSILKDNIINKFNNKETIKSNSTDELIDEKNNIDVRDYEHRNESNYYYTINESEKIIYDHLHYLCLQIIEDKETNLIIPINEKEFNPHELGEDYVKNVVLAFKNDYPYLAWWLNSAEFEITYMTNKEKTTIDDVVLTLNPLEYFKGDEDYTLDKEAVEKANYAYTKAKEVANVSYDSGRELLTYFKETIISYADYDDNIRNKINEGINDYEVSMGTNFIYVFDDDQNTNVVCSGYSSAFLLLCDLYNVKDVYYKEGTMDGTRHAWNTITNNGNRFIVDITNSREGTVGSDGSLFLKIIPYEKEYVMVSRSDTTTYIEE